MVCKQCCRIMDEGETKCKSCGWDSLKADKYSVPKQKDIPINKETPSDDNEASKPAKKKKKKWKTVIIFMLIFLFFAGIGIVYELFFPQILDWIRGNNYYDDSGDYETETQIEETEPESTIPYELQKYESGLAYEGETYRVTLKQSSYLNCRSTPEFKNGNIKEELSNGSEIYVEYIYEDYWAVFKLNDKYLFGAIYTSDGYQLLTPVD